MLCQPGRDVKIIENDEKETIPQICADVNFETGADENEIQISLLSDVSDDGDQKIGTKKVEIENFFDIYNLRPNV